MPLLETKGAASAQGFGLSLGGADAEKVYIEDVFSTYLYTGTGATQTITNGIDLSTKGGLVWIKCRSAAYDHALFDTVRGNRYGLSSDTTNGQTYSAVDSDLTSFNGSGFSLGSGYAWALNNSSQTFASWTFRKQPKFFDVVTYTGNGTTNRSISHSLGSTPGCIIIKRTDSTGLWYVWHRSATGNGVTGPGLYLNDAFVYPGDTAAIAQTQGASTFTVNPTGSSLLNVNGATYVAYLFAHNAGGFGLSGTDNVISCGSFTTDGSGNATVSLGYEAQFVLFKGASGANANGDPWGIGDVMRGLTQTNIARLIPNLSNAEDNITSYVPTPTATGFDAKGFAGSTTYIYIAIRRGPMKVPTSGTSVFKPITFSTPNTLLTTNFVVDTVIENIISGWGNAFLVTDRLRGQNQSLSTSSSAVESNALSSNSFAYNNGYFDSTSSGNLISYTFSRAPGFFDEVCYTGTGSNTTQTHNLGVVPEMMIVKQRTAVTGATIWAVYHSTLGAGQAIRLNSNVGPITDNAYWNGTTPTASVFSLGNQQATNVSTGTYVAYLFATCAGVSKVGSYTGNGSSQTINCGFTGGARFVLIKRTDSTGDWYVWDSARGIVAGNDPHLSLNSTAAEVTTNDSIDTDSIGFIVNQLAATDINVSSATYIFLAIA